MGIWLLKSCFWISVFLLFYIYVGYPIVIWLLGRFRGRRLMKEPFRGTISVVIAARNEAETLPDKISQILGSQQADQIIEVLVASDGSTDNTVDVIQASGDPRVHCVAFENRRGKSAVLNEVVPRCTGDVIVFADARQGLAVDSIARLLENFADPEVGVVSGELMFRAGTGDAGVVQGVGFYWKYEKWIRKSESRFRSVPGATGALYAIRKGLFHSFPGEALLDDVIIPMQAILNGGGRCIFEESAFVFDTPSVSTEAENIRKRRTIAGNIQLLRLFPQWLHPKFNPIWFEFLSHKMSRIISPFLLFLALMTNLVLVYFGEYLIFFFFHITFYWMTLMAHILKRFDIRLGWLNVPLMFFNLNKTTALAWWDAFTSGFEPKWEQSTK